MVAMPLAGPSGIGPEMPSASVFPRFGETRCFCKGHSPRSGSLPGGAECVLLPAAPGG